MEFYRRSHVFCFPSLAETSGNVLLEAMAMCLPVVTINRGGPAEIVDDTCGYRIEPVSPEYVKKEMARILSQLAKDTDRIIELGSNARQRVATNYTWDKKGEILRDIYSNVID